MDGAPPPPEFLWRKHLGLFAYLVLAPHRSVSREQLVGLLWADKSESSARHSLREAMRHVRRVVGDDGLSTAQDRVTLVAEVTTDLDALAARAAADDWEGAAALVGGRFLDGIEVPDAPAFEEWLASERRGWTARCVQLLARCADGRLQQGRAAAGADAAERALALDPLSDAAVYALMTAHAVRGARGAALAVWDAFGAQLDDVGGVPPKALTALADRLRAGRVPAPADDPAVASTSRRTPLVGRAAPLTTLLDAWTRASRTPRTLLGVIEGDPGVGRSRLLAELVARVRLAEADVVTVRAVPADARDLWSGLVGLLRGGLVDAPGVGGAQPAALARLAADLPEWADRTNSRHPDPPDLPTAAREVLAAAVEARPVLLAIDDAQWLDAQTLGWLEQLLRDSRARPLAVCCTVSRGEGAAALDTLRARVGHDHQVAVRVEPLTLDDLAALVADALPAWAGEQGDRLARRLHADTAGRPLLAVELLHAVTLGVDLTGDVWPAPHRTMEQTFPGEVPATLVVAVRAGVRALPRVEQDLLGAIAAIGDRVSLDVLRRATGAAAADLTAALDRLEWACWIALDGRGYGIGSRVVRDAILLDLLTPGQAQRFRDAGR